jgi:hypothetical protein
MAESEHKQCWNYRVLRHRSPDPSEPDFLQVHEVYSEDEKPTSCSTDGARVGGESIEELRSVLERMLAALNKPVLDYEAFADESETPNRLAEALRETAEDMRRVDIPIRPPTHSFRKTVQERVVNDGEFAEALLLELNNDEQLREWWDEGIASGSAAPLDLTELRREARRRIATAKKADD